MLLVFELVAGKLACENETWWDRVEEAKQYIELVQGRARARGRSEEVCLRVTV